MGSGQNCITWFGLVAGYSGEGIISFPAFSLHEGMATANKLNCDDHLQTGPAKLPKMRVVWLGGYLCTVILNKC